MRRRPGAGPHASGSVAVRAGTTGLAAAVMVAAVVVGGRGPWHGAMVAVVAGALLAARRTAPPGARSVAALAACYLVVLWSVTATGLPLLWPLPLALAVGLYALASRVPALGLLTDWFAWGRGDARAWTLVAAVVPVSAAGLLAWSAWSAWSAGSTRAEGADLQAAYRDLAADRPLGVVLLAGVGFALLNAAAEELVYNGVVQHALRRDLPAASAVLLTAAVFGATHWYGFPSGWAGVALATGYGLLLAAVRHRSRGLVLPWVAHVAADLTIVAILAAAWFA